MVAQQAVPHAFMTVVDIPGAPPMAIPLGQACSRGDMPRVVAHYHNILAGVLAEPDGLARMRKLFYLNHAARNEGGMCGWQDGRLLPHLLDIPPDEAILHYLAAYAISGLEGCGLAEKVLDHWLMVDGNIPLHCPACSQLVATSLDKRYRTCPLCHHGIASADFGGRLWHKCRCGKLVHIDGELVACACGMPHEIAGLRAWNRQRVSSSA